MYDAAAAGHVSDLEWVRVVLTADPGVRLEDIEDQPPPRRNEHRRVGESKGKHRQQTRPL